MLESLLCDGLKENVVGTLKSLTVKGCPALKEVFCQENSLSTLVFTDCPELALLRCNTNQLTAVDLSGCPKLEEFYAWDNQLASLDLSGNKALKLLELQRNRFTTLEVADMPDLQHIWCDGLHKENGEDVVGCITTLTVRNCPKLEELFCQENSISSLTVSGCPGLIKLCGWRNALTTLDLTGCESLATLQIAANQLSTVTLKGCAALDLLDIPDNRLTSLDLSDCINLRETWMQGNPMLTSLDLSKNNALQIFRCMATGIKSLDPEQPRLSDLGLVRRLRHGVDFGERMPAAERAQMPEQPPHVARRQRLSQTQYLLGRHQQPLRSRFQRMR